MKISDDALALIKRYVIFNFHAFHDEAGWMIGYSTRLGDRGLHIDDPSMHINEPEAIRLRDDRLRLIERYLDIYVCVHLAQHEFDALACLFYFSERLAALPESPVIKALNAGDRAGAARAMQTDFHASAAYRATVQRHIDQARLFTGKLDA
jgi:GH24 family phage-related lysozyme (muramidase)